MHISYNIVTKRFTCLLNQKLLRSSNKYKHHNRKLENEINKQLIKSQLPIFEKLFSIVSVKIYKFQK